LSVMVKFERLSGLWNYRLSRPTGTFFTFFFQNPKNMTFYFFELPHTFSRTLVHHVTSYVKTFDAEWKVLVLILKKYCLHHRYQYPQIIEWESIVRVESRDFSVWRPSLNAWLVSGQWSVWSLTVVSATVIRSARFYAPCKQLTS